MRYYEKLQRMFRFAQDLSELSVCERSKVGCVIFPTDCTAVYAIGYNGPPRTIKHYACISDPCGCAHAEINALLKLMGQTNLVLYCTRFPCRNCVNAIINSGAISLMFYDGESILHDSMNKYTTGANILTQAGIDWQHTKEIPTNVDLR